MAFDGEHWRYVRDGDLVATDPDRPCGHCGKPNTADGCDGCLGLLPGVRNACCGHGDTSSAYIQLTDGHELRGLHAILWVRTIGALTMKDCDRWLVWAFIGCGAVVTVLFMVVAVIDAFWSG